MARRLSQNNFFELLKRNRERVTLLGVAVAFLMFVGGGLYLQKKNRFEKEQPFEAIPKTVELSIQKKSETGAQGEESPRQASSFFLRPSPEELLQQLASMENLNENVVGEKYTGLRVLWPVYFFSVQETEGGKATLLLDVSENGFGVLVDSEIDLAAYPQIRTLQASQKIWIAGEILAVDPAGTGTIYIKVEHLSFSEEEPFSAGLRKPEK